MRPTATDKIQKNYICTRVFEDKIDGAFLVKVLVEVLRKTGDDLTKYYDYDFGPERGLFGDESEAYYDICRMIIGAHRADTVFDTEETRKEKELTLDYRRKINAAVTERLKLRRFSSVFFPKNPIAGKESYLYYPVPYELYAVGNRALSLIPLMKDVSSYGYLNLMTKGLGALNLLGTGLLGTVYPVLTDVIETYTKLLCLIEAPECRDFYVGLTEIELLWDKGNKEVQRAFMKYFTNRLADKDKKETDRYLRFGFVDGIPNYHRIVKQNPYSERGLLSYLLTVVPDEMREQIDALREWYAVCSNHVHGSVLNSGFPVLHYFEICKVLYMTMTDAYLMMTDNLGFSADTNGVDLIGLLDADMDVLNAAYERKTEELLEQETERTM